MTEPRKNPWAWIPTLYFAEGLPYVAVMTVSVILYKKLGISNTDIALYTSWLYLPWVIKPFWSPFVDLLKNKRWWILTMQILIGAGLGGVALTIPAPEAFRLSLCFFWLVAFSSATHDIAADGFYMLALKERDQALYVGIRSTFYRIATIVGQGLLVILAGTIEAYSGLTAAHFTATAGPRVESRTASFADSLATHSKAGTPTFVFTPTSIRFSSAPIPSDSARSLMAQAQAANCRNHFVEASEQTATQVTARQNAGLNALERFLRDTFGEEQAQATPSTPQEQTPAVALVGVRLSSPPEAGEQIVLTTSLERGDRSISLLQGEHLTFDRSNWNHTAYLVVQADSKLRGTAEAEFRALSGNIPLAWSITFFLLAAFFIAIALYHRHSLPRPSADRLRARGDAGSILREFGATFAEFFRKPQAGVAILFMLLYRLPEAQLVKLINPFLLDPVEKGGLGLTTGEVGFVYGTVGIVGLTLGGIIGGLAAARGGLRRWLWPMAWSISLTCATFVYLAYVQPTSLWAINTCVFIEQFGYGFGFTAYMLFLMYFAEGEHQTAHYAICTAFMALGMMLPGMMAGWLQELIGYRHFFVWVMLCCVATIAVCAFIRIRPDYGKEEQA